MKLKDKVAVITGAGRENGVGAATAKLLAQEGVHVVIHCLKSEEEAKKIVAQCSAFGVSAALFLGDLTKQSVCQALAKHVKEKWGRADIIVNCLGATKPAPYEKLESLTEEDFNHVLAVNVIAPYLVVQAFQSLLRASGDGAIVNISSTAALTGKSSSIAYAAAKGAENSLTLALAQALSPEVRVNAICPAFIDSSWWDKFYKGQDDKYQALVNSVKEGNLLNRVLKPIDVATMILSVIKNPVMTGEIIRLDAGAHVGKANFR
jgi:3-oxoacyl-[acyl-carrier protein] reductase